MTKILLRGAKVLQGKEFKRLDILLEDGRISSMAPQLSLNDNDGRNINCDHFFIAPAFADVHVHLREPGYSYKATIKQESLAALKGGFTVVASMPNLNPPPDSMENLQQQLDIIERDSSCRVIPYACITKSQNGQELADLRSLAAYVAGFSDDGKGVQDDSTMLQAFAEVKALGKRIVAHCEVEELVRGGVIHAGIYAHENNLPGNPSESEWKMVERDLKLVEETMCPYHVCHVSTKESIQLIRQAKQNGLPVTCETAPHYLYFTDEDLQDDGRFKMNPPIRAKEDQEELIAGIIDGTVDMLATDHAPHAEDEKSKGLLNSANGVVGLETAFAASYTSLVKGGHISLEKLIELMSLTPREFLGLESQIKVGQKADFVVFDIDSESTVQSEDFLSAGKASPFTGEILQGQIEYTFYNGELVWQKN